MAAGIDSAIIINKLCDDSAAQALETALKRFKEYTDDRLVKMANEGVSGKEMLAVMTFAVGFADVLGGFADEIRPD